MCDWRILKRFEYSPSIHGVSGIAQANKQHRHTEFPAVCRTFNCSIITWSVRHTLSSRVHRMGSQTVAPTFLMIMLSIKCLRPVISRTFLIQCITLRNDVANDGAFESQLVRLDANDDHLTPVWSQTDLSFAQLQVAACEAHIIARTFRSSFRCLREKQLWTQNQECSLSNHTERSAQKHNRNLI